MMKLLFALLFSLSILSAQDQVVCIHGFMGGKWTMSFLKKNLKKDGWDVVNYKYKSRDDTIEGHANQLCQTLSKLKKSGEPIHFVTHSMGGLVLKATLNHPECPEEAKIGRVVLIAPPLKGAMWARYLSQYAVVRKIAKPFAGKELLTAMDFDHLGPFPDTLEKMLVIAGTFNINPIIPGASDGTVAVEETRPDCQSEHITMPAQHVQITFSKKVCGKVRKFLNG